jgi:hypothetical protein
VQYWSRGAYYADSAMGGVEHSRGRGAEQQGRPWLQRWGLRLGVGLLLLLVVVLVVLWWRAPELYDSSDVDPGDQAAATATTRAGILAVFAATIAAIGAIVALAETRRANLAAHERELGALAEAQRGAVGFSMFVM